MKSINNFKGPLLPSGMYVKSVIKGHSGRNVTVTTVLVIRYVHGGTTVPDAHVRGRSDPVDFI